MRFQNITINNKFRNALINHYFNKIESSLKAIFNEFDLLCCRLLEFLRYRKGEKSGYPHQTKLGDNSSLYILSMS